MTLTWEDPAEAGQADELAGDERDLIYGWRNRIVGYGTKPADQFLFHPDNAREHPLTQRSAVGGSLKSIGWVAPVIENARTGYLLDGHERIWQALQEDPAMEIPFIAVDISEEEEATFLASFDYTGTLAKFNRDKWEELVARLPELPDPRLSKAIQAMRDDKHITWTKLPDLEIGGVDMTPVDPAGGQEKSCPKCGFTWVEDL